MAEQVWGVRVRGVRGVPDGELRYYVVALEWPQEDLEPVVPDAVPDSLGEALEERARAMVAGLFAGVPPQWLGGADQANADGYHGAARSAWMEDRAQMMAAMRGQGQGYLAVLTGLDPRAPGSSPLLPGLYDRVGTAVAACEVHAVDPEVLRRRVRDRAGEGLVVLQPVDLRGLIDDAARTATATPAAELFSSPEYPLRTVSGQGRPEEASGWERELMHVDQWEVLRDDRLERWRAVNGMGYEGERGVWMALWSDRERTWMVVPGLFQNPDVARAASLMSVGLRRTAIGRPPAPATQEHLDRAMVAVFGSTEAEPASFGRFVTTSGVEGDQPW